MVKIRWRHSAASKFRIALETLEGSKASCRLCSVHEIHAKLTQSWENRLL